MMELARTILFAYMETVICDIFVSIFCERKAKWKGMQAILWWGGYCIIKVAYQKMLTNYMAIKIAVGLLMYTLFMAMRFKERIWKIFLCVAGYMSLIMVCDCIFLLVWGNIFAERLNDPNFSWGYSTVVSVVSKMIEFLLFTWLHRRFAKDRAMGILDSRGWLKFLMLTGITIVVLLMAWIDGGSNDVTILTLSLGLMMMNVMFYFTMWEIVSKERENQEYRLSQEKVRGQIRLYESMEEAYREQRKRVHEFKNHMGCIQGLLELENAPEAKEYVNKIQTAMAADDNWVKTGNVIVDVIVNQKYREALKEHITFVMHLDKLECFPLQEEDTVILLSNLLDNALEACKKIPNPAERVIKIRLMQKGTEYLLVVNNTVQEAVAIKNDVAETTKADKYQHGIGMHNIKEVLRKYDAAGECKCEGNWFTYSIIINGQA